MLSRSPGLRAIVTAVTMVLVPLLNFSIVLLVVLVTFSVLGTSLFGDKLKFCHAFKLDGVEYENNIDVGEFKYVYNQTECYGTAFNANQYEVGLSWKSVSSNFDYVGNSMMTLMELITMEGWQLIMYPVMDIPDDSSSHPVMNNSEFNGIYFVLFIIFGSIFLNYLFVGIVVFKFNKARELEKTSSSFLTTVQMVWLENIFSVMSKLCVRHIKPPSKDARFGLQLPAWKLVQDTTFSLVIDVCICLNILVMATEYFNQPKAASKAHNILEILFVSIFSLEICLRFLAVSFNTFWQSNWNRFDTVIVAASIVGVTRVDLPFNVTILRILRISRLFKVFATSKNFKILTRTLLYSLPALVNIISLLFLVVFVFAVVGMNLFGKVHTDGEIFTTFENFGSFGSSMLLMFRVITGEQWNSAMHLLRDDGHTVAVPFFIIFIVISNFILLNLFIAVILENFENALHTEHNKTQKRNLEDFYHDWSELHLELGLPTRLDDCLPSYSLFKLLRHLEMPLGLKFHPDAENVKGQINLLYYVRFINSLMLKQGEYFLALSRNSSILLNSIVFLWSDLSGNVYFVDVIYALLRAADKNNNTSGNYTFFSMQQKHDFLLALTQIYKKRVVYTLKKKLQHEHFSALDVLAQVQAVRAIEACYKASKLRGIFFNAVMLSPTRQAKIFSTGQSIKLSNFFSLDSVHVTPKGFFRAFTNHSVSSDSSSEGGLSYESSDFSSISSSDDSSSSLSDNENSNSESSSDNEEGGLWENMERVRKPKSERLMLPQLVESTRIKEYAALTTQMEDEKSVCDDEDVWEDYSKERTLNELPEDAPPSIASLQLSSSKSCFPVQQTCRDDPQKKGGEIDLDAF